MFAYPTQNNLLYTSSCGETTPTDAPHVRDTLDWLRKLAVRYPGYLIAEATLASLADGVVRTLARPVCGQPPLPAPWYGTAPLRKLQRAPRPPIDALRGDPFDD